MLTSFDFSTSLSDESDDDDELLLEDELETFPSVGTRVSAGSTFIGDERFVRGQFRFPGGGIGGGGSANVVVPSS